MAGGIKRGVGSTRPLRTPQNQGSSPVAPFGNGATSGFWTTSGLHKFSIWQPPDMDSPPPQFPKPQSQSNELAIALDAAVQAAVIRALGTITSPTYPAPSRLDDDLASIASNSSTRTVHPDDPLLARLRTATELNQSLVSRLDAADAASTALAERLSTAEITARRLAAERDADIAARDSELESLRADLDRASKNSAAQLAALRDQIRSAGGKAGARANAERARADRGAAALTRHVDRVEATLLPQLEALSSRIAQLEVRVSEADSERPDDIATDQCVCAACAEEIEKSRADAVEGISVVRSRLKRIETLVEGQGKAAEESAVLQSGAVDAVKAECDKLRTEVAGLKKLVECNLRAHSSVESIVKENVSLITKNVCIAMRQYTKRIIDENNVALTAKFAPVVTKPK